MQRGPPSGRQAGAGGFGRPRRALGRRARAWGHQLERDEALLPWARRILVRRFLDQRRWSLRRPQCSIEGIEVSTALGTSADAVDLRQAVAQLPRQDRALLVLHYWQGLSIAECARDLDVPEGTAKSRINRALTRLRERLGEGER